MARQGRVYAFVAAASAATLIWACGGDGTVFTDSPAGSTGTDAGSGGASTASSGGGDASSSSSSSSSAGGSTSSSSAGGSGGNPPSCEGKTAVPGEEQYTLTFEDNEREYEVQVPASYDGTSAMPLVFDFHGYTESKDQQQSRSGFAELAESEGFVVVRANGYRATAISGRSWNGGDNCCGGAQSQNLDDVGLVRAIAAEVMDRTCIDPRRVYATGLSNGAAMSHRLACDAADLFAAVAAVSYPLDYEPFSQCQPSRPIGVMHSHGTNDFIVPFGGSFTAQPTADSFAYWGTTNGCTGDPVETYSQGSSVCETYETCTDGVKTTLCTVSGGHILYDNNDDVPIAELSWAFLTQHVLP